MRAAVRSIAGLVAVLALSMVVAVGCGDDDNGDDDSNFTPGSQFNPNISYDSINYGGQTYRTVKIGEQTWTAENLNYNAPGSICFGNVPDNCAKYGRLYDWETATNACPAGWHLPSDDEWETLVNYAGGESTAGKKLKAKIGWNNKGNGTDDYGFSALPGGVGNSGGDFYDIGNDGLWWSATEYNADYAWYRVMDYDYDNVGRFTSIKAYLYSVRCLQDN